MAKGKKQPDQDPFDDDDGQPTMQFKDESAPVPSGSAVEQPAPFDPVSSSLDGKAILAQMFGLDLSDVASLVKAKEEANTFAMAAQAQEYAQKMRSVAEQKRLQEWVSKSAAERTQDVVNATWLGKEPDAVPFKVRMAWNRDAGPKPESITLTIPARSKDEAEGRYRSVCGIRNSEHPVVASPLAE